MTKEGYYRFPTICDQTVVFVVEDDLWAVSAMGGPARRLTSNLGEVSRPCFSPDGEWLAFTGKEEGPPEVFLMPASGGPAKRITYLGADCMTVGWSPDGKSVIFASNYGQPFFRLHKLYEVPREGGLPKLLPTGPALFISYGPSGGVVIGRHGLDPARWKRYRGGTMGDLWIDIKGTGEFKRLIKLNGNLSRPMWVGERIYFLSDHEGIGNLYSCLPSGEDLRRHTDHEEFYARNPSTDGKRIVYHAGADLYLYDPASDKSTKIEVEFRSPQVQRNRKFVEAAKFLESYALHPNGHSVALTTRGKIFSMGNWEGAVTQHGEPDGVRYRLTRYLSDGKRLITITDKGGEEAIESHYANELKAPERLELDLDIGRPVDLEVSPKKDQIVLSNHRHELILVDLVSRKAKVLDKSRYARIMGMAWSPDGRWVCYSISESMHTAGLKLCNVETGEIRALTRPVLYDISPSFDPDGKYLYFLSYREFDPVYDNLHFDLGFPRGMRPYLITLRKDLSSPFVPVPKAPGEKASNQAKEDKKEKEEKPLVIDLEGIEDRIVAFPVPEGRYEQIKGIKGKVLFTSFPVEGSLAQLWPPPAEPPAKGSLEVYDFEEQEKEVLITGVTNFEVSMDHKTLIYRAGNRLRVLKAGEKPDEKAEKEGPGRKSGWLDLSRIKVSVEPSLEWKQMYREAWRLQREHFWTEDMSQVDWQRVYQRYLPLTERVATRSEFSDLIWEMQGELGTSHAYEFGGDYRPEPRYDQGLLGVDFEYDEKTEAYKIKHIVKGDPWDEMRDSPLNKPGINVKEGQVLLAVNGRQVGKDCSPQELLVNQAGCEVTLTFATDDGPRTVTVKTLKDETPARYREWVEKNRQWVHEQTDGRVGYVHIPNMGPLGYAEFHRYYLAEVDREALIVDVRFNGGGHVSQLLLEKLARRRLGYDLPRWGEVRPYPEDSVAGPMVALTNEYAGSDGDIFSHGFKLMKLGPLIGKRTWGGVIGIWARYRLVDGSITTQPEFSFWFKDVGWGVENYGTDPDIEVEITPQDYAKGKDPQLERAVKEIMKRLEEQPPLKPDFGGRPSRALPKLPKR